MVSQKENPAERVQKWVGGSKVLGTRISVGGGVKMIKNVSWGSEGDSDKTLILSFKKESELKVEFKYQKCSQSELSTL